MARPLTLPFAHPFITVILLFFFPVITRFFWTGYKARSRSRGLPGPPHHWFWGHIPILFQLLKDVPTRVAPLYYADLLREKYQLGDVFYFDLWPIGMQFLFILDPTITNQLIVKQLTPKNDILKLFMRFLVGSSENLLSGDGHSWVHHRKAFNRAFSSNALNALIPDIIEECEVFCDVLEDHAQRHEVFRLEEKATLLTIDVIARAVLDTRLNSQVSRNELAVAIIDQVGWIPQARPDRPWEIFNPLFLLMMWRNNRKMDSFISAKLEHRSKKTELKKSKHIIDLAMDTYFHENGKLLDDSKKAAICQIKTLLFAGHDTVSGTLCYAYHLLSKHPKALNRIREEHSMIFGEDLRAAAQIIEAQPSILSRLEFTLAVLKETLRMFPPASTVRQGSKDLFITDPETGVQLPTENFAVSPITIGMHRHPKHFPEPHTFVPERFLSENSTASESSNLAYLPFSKGPRVCIGQELALIEMKIALVMTLRKFDIRAAFEDLHLLKHDGSYWPNDESGVQKVYGEEAYQVMMGSAKPREGMPARVSLRETI